MASSTRRSIGAPRADRGAEVLKGRAPAEVEVVGPAVPGTDQVLTPDALAFLAALHHEFEPRRQGVLEARRTRQEAVDGGAALGLRSDTEAVRLDPSWRVGGAAPR